MAAAEQETGMDLEPVEDSEDEFQTDADLGLSDRQVRALEKLTALGAAPRADEDAPYSKNPQVRALQLVYEDRLGGPGRGQGRKRELRASELVADHVRNKLGPKMIKVLDEALEDKNIRVRLQAMESGLKIERDDAELKMEEQKIDLETDNRENLIEALFALVGEAHTEAALEGFIEGSAIEISTEENSEGSDGEIAGIVGEGADDEGIENPSGPSENGSNATVARDNGSGRSKSDGESRSNPFTQTARRRASER